MNIIYSSALNELTEVNSSFDKGILRVAYTGRNPNNSFISKEAFERCIGSIYNCPIVCNYMREEDEFGGHDVELKHNDDGVKLVNITQPVGVIPESANYWWEQIEDSNGIHEYLCVDALVWKRQEAYEKIKSEGITEESMEIKVKNGKMTDGCYHIHDFEFTAFCLLGNVNPCFESASLQVFSTDDFKAQFSKMMEEIKICFSANNGNSAEKEPDSYRPEGGITNLNEDKKPNAAYALSGEQFREELMSALAAETLETNWGTAQRYMYVDYDGESGEVFCWDVGDWKLYGFKYSKSGDAMKVDFDSKRRKKFAFIDFDEGSDVEYSLESIFSVVSQGAAAAREQELKQEYETEKASAGKKYSTLETEVAELRKYKADAISAQRSDAEAEVFSQFEDLSGIEAFEELRAGCADMEVGEIEERCYALRGRFTAQKFSAPKADKPPKLPVDKNPAANEPYGGLFAKYGANKD